MKRSGMDLGVGKSSIRQRLYVVNDPTPGIGPFFRRQLYEFVNDPSTDSIASWSESGKSFIVWNEDEFSQVFMQRSNLETKGFKVVESCDEQLEIAADFFVRGQPEKAAQPRPCERKPTPEVMAGLERAKNIISEVPGPTLSSVCPELYKIVAPKFIPPCRSFRRELYEVVDDPSTDSVVSWSESGESFVVWNEYEFTRDVLPRCLGYKKMVSFTGHLGLMGFRKVVESDKKCEYANKYFLRGHPHLVPPQKTSHLYISPRVQESLERLNKTLADHKAHLDKAKASLSV